MQAQHPILADLVLVGGGHAQIAVLKAFAMKPVPGLRLTIVTSSSRTPYSGMLPGYVEGVWHDDDLHIDLRHLAQAANARIIIATVTGINADLKQIYFDDRPALGFDVLSLNIGGQPNINSIKGAANNTIPVKPIAGFQERFEAFFAQPLPRKLAVIGGGAAGCELALALITRWISETGLPPDMTIISQSHMLMPQMAPRAGALVEKKLRSCGAKIILGQAVLSVESEILTLDNQQTVSFDACFLVTQVAAPDWLGASGLQLNKSGFVAVRDSLQSETHPYVFAAGDVASISQAPRPKAGVFAVRAGKILARNLRNYILRKPLARWAPQKRYLALIGTGEKQAIATRGDFALSGSLFWHLKCWIDRRFMRKFKNLSMPAVPPKNPFPGLLEPHPPAQSQATPQQYDPAFAAMRCLGCAAKTSHQVLQNAMQEAIELAIAQGADADLMPPSGLETDSAILPDMPSKTGWVQSVDIVSQIVSDPFVLGEIATVHAFSDIYASLSKPLFSLAIINLPESKLTIQTNQLTHILAGALMAHSASGVRLVGGHTSEGGGMSVGFAVTGSGAQPITQPTLQKPNEWLLVVTKSIGTGVIMAADMQLQADASSVDAAIASMRLSNAKAADIFLINNVLAATDVTGFGLARHAQNLALRLGVAGCVIDLSSLPLLSGVTQLLAAGITSSLHPQNRRAVKIPDSDLAHDMRFEALFDPQTSGGLLGVFARSDAENALQTLQQNNHQAAIIGRFDAQTNGVKIVSGGW
ncbi:selenide, water dikinase SelD [Alphaproteobacteria bacterium]|nr:selenide, water dikinase SelD [Alphaproteobacteria bacterium]